RAFAFRPDAILMDVRMPVMDGLQATQILRDDEWGKGVKIVAVTASAFEQDREEFLARGMDGYMSKPYKAHALLEEIGRLLNLKYVYEAVEIGAGEEKRVPTFSLVEVKAAVSSELVAEWESLILQGRIDALPAAIEAVGLDVLAPFADLVRQKVDDFDYDGVEALLAQLKA
ncbi:MAG: response regulator, partial [Bacteroidia bacterium]|nr:response regulator [Bacteroidia bacterium]